MELVVSLYLNFFLLVEEQFFFFFFFFLLGKLLLTPSQIVSPLFHFGKSQNVVIFEKSINTFRNLPIVLFKKLNSSTRF